MILVQLHNKPQGLYSRFFAFLPLFIKIKLISAVEKGSFVTITVLR